MGHLFSRAIKRLTFGASRSGSTSASRNPLPGSGEQQGPPAGQREPLEADRPPIAQAIPVGQSIDSAEYAAFENASSALPQASGRPSREAAPAEAAKENEDTSDHVESNAITQPVLQEEAPARDAGGGGADQRQLSEGAPGRPGTLEGGGEQSSPAVEEAVIKIQALVRGHLTRKALKDAQQQAASAAPNALGQSQFDEDSLMKSPLNGIFAPSSPLCPSSPNLSETPGQQQQQPGRNSRVPAPLESIAEDEVEVGSQQAGPQLSELGQRRRLSARNLAARSNEEGAQSAGAASPSASPSTPHSPSLATASIDIHCDTPASASIDILDHSSKPSFGLASVLHQRPEPELEPAAAEAAEAALEEDAGREVGGERAAVSTQRETLNLQGDDADADDEGRLNVLGDISGMPSGSVPAPPAAAFENSASGGALVAGSLPASPPHIRLAGVATNSHSIDSAEAAAIRIQSAFRGYHTRKHSPFRRRSPASAPLPKTNGFTNGGHASRSPLLRQPVAAALEEALDGHESAEDENNNNTSSNSNSNTININNNISGTGGGGGGGRNNGPAEENADDENADDDEDDDEAIGSGRSSPALVASEGESSSEGEAGAAHQNQNQGRGSNRARGHAPTSEDAGPQQGGSGAGGNSGGGNASGGSPTNRSKKKNRNKRNRGKK